MSSYSENLGPAQKTKPGTFPRLSLNFRLYQYYILIAVDEKNSVLIFVMAAESGT
ncbi:hypothetical protein BpJC7_06210 [Weizmannia acidilactici]|uniref:Uncharacterized protein n=1 Tax=Weizmannia acidilactici TaxID=2607726 RepID=A0A5J4JG71_9BACI|nr:hypothetical protein BpJC4_05180 [Weizmannia acidilactici]GER69318.1 hypothetical protein BpJC7_06210 [Weizmannia acidilactici]GER72356.1 hypothetical protein BpPP18_04230 [Weizmannia acidilactici]